MYLGAETNMPVHAMATSAAELDVVGCRQHRLPRRPDLGGAIVDGVAHPQDLGCRVGGVAPCACLLERGDRARLEVPMRDRHGGEFDYLMPSSNPTASRCRTSPGTTRRVPSSMTAPDPFH